VTILVVEDNDIVRFVLLVLLRDLGYQAVGVCDGRIAFNYLQTAAERP
jgi:CheY-like chemotaxis protein